MTVKPATVSELHDKAEAIAEQTPDVDTPTVHEAWLRVMAQVRAVGKDGRYDAGKTKFNFRGVDGVVNAVGPALRTHRVHIRPIHIGATYREVEAGSNRTLMRECTATVTYRVTGPAGDWFDGQAQGEALDSSDKGSAKAQSVAYRVYLLQALCIPTDEPDPDESYHERAAAPAESEPQHPDAVTLLVELADLAEVGDKLRTQLVERAGAASAAAALQDEGWRNWLRQAIEYHRKSLEAPAEDVPTLPLDEATT